MGCGPMLRISEAWGLLNFHSSLPRATRRALTFLFWLRYRPLAAETEPAALMNDLGARTRRLAKEIA
jgi:hypothetical protein